MSLFSTLIIFQFQIQVGVGTSSKNNFFFQIETLFDAKVINPVHDLANRSVLPYSIIRISVIQFFGIIKKHQISACSDVLL